MALDTGRAGHTTEAASAAALYRQSAVSLAAPRPQCSQLALLTCRRPLRPSFIRAKRGRSETSNAAQLLEASTQLSHHQQHSPKPPAPARSALHRRSGRFPATRHASSARRSACAFQGGEVTSRSNRLHNKALRSTPSRARPSHAGQPQVYRSWSPQLTVTTPSCRERRVIPAIPHCHLSGPSSHSPHASAANDQSFIRITTRGTLSTPPTQPPSAHVASAGRGRPACASRDCRVASPRGLSLPQRRARYSGFANPPGAGNTTERVSAIFSIFAHPARGPPLLSGHIHLLPKPVACPQLWRKMRWI